MESPVQTSGCGKLFLWVWLLFWVAAVCVFDVVSGLGLYRQSQTNHFATVEGEIISSRVNVTRDNDGETRSAKIKYHYEVDGQEYESETITFNGMSFTSADTLVSEFPKGAKRPVYFNPSQHDQSVLRTGLQAGDFFILIFLTPFNVIAWIGLSFMLPLDKLPMGPISISRSQQALTNRFQIRNWFPLQAAGILAGIAGFLSMFAVALLSFVISGWFPIILGFAVIGLAAIVGALFLPGYSILEVDTISNRIKLIKGDKEHTLDAPQGLEFQPINCKLTLRSVGSDDSLPAIECYSRDAVSWLQQELKTLVRD